MTHSFVPCETPSSWLPGWQKENILSLPPGFHLFSQFFSRLSRKLYDPKTIAHFRLRNIFHKHARSRNICPNLQHISGVKHAPDGYLNNKGGIWRVWRAESFPTPPPLLRHLRRLLYPLQPLSRGYLFLSLDFLCPHLLLFLLGFLGATTRPRYIFLLRWLTYRYTWACKFCTPPPYAGHTGNHRGPPRNSMPRFDRGILSSCCLRNQEVGRVLSVGNSRRFHTWEIVGTLMGHSWAQLGLKKVARLSSMVLEKRWYVWLRS